MKTLTIEDLAHDPHELDQQEMRQIAGGMMNLGNHHVIKPDDEGTTWVPEGTIKVYLAGVQIG